MESLVDYLDDLLFCSSFLLQTLENFSNREIDGEISFGVEILAEDCREVIGVLLDKADEFI